MLTIVSNLNGVPFIRNSGVAVSTIRKCMWQTCKSGRSRDSVAEPTAVFHNQKEGFNLWKITAKIPLINTGVRKFSTVSTYRCCQYQINVVQKVSKMAQVLSGTQVSKEIQQELKAEVARVREQNPDFAPGLAIVQVGGREDSNVYIRMKIKAASEIGIVANHVRLPRSITEVELLQELDKLNQDSKVHGIIVQMPLDSDNPIDSHAITDAVDPSKDVDGLCTINEGRVAIGDLKSGFLPCTPFGCIELIRRSGVTIAGAKAVVLGRSKIVGTPVSELLKWNDATVTVCHSKTKNLAAECRAADILVVGIGRPEMVKADWVKPGAVVIDCGINAIPDATKKSGQRLVGDVAYEECSKVAGSITPVPGGVGPMTVCMLMKNTVLGALKSLKGDGKSWDLKPLALHVKDPVPK